MLPLGRGVSKAKTGHKWGTKFDSFWCCYGTGVDFFSIQIADYCTLYSFSAFYPCILRYFALFFLPTTGIESFSKLGDSIYFEEEGNDPALYIIQYISSSFNWKSGNLVLNQTVAPVASWDPYLRVTFTFSPNAVPSTFYYECDTACI